MSKDLFSRQAGLYAKYRPSYPVEFIEYILQFVKEKKSAWDCATGNGQAALRLADHFTSVYATDSSTRQIELAIPKHNINYSVAKAEQTSFADNSFDLITIAQAYHWLAFDAFAKEAERVAKNGAIIAAWCYNIPFAHHERIDLLITNFYNEVVGPYWDAERRWVDQEYQTVPFPFAELPTRKFEIAVNWDPTDLAGYLSSWSSVQHFVNAKHFDPVEEFTRQLSAAWPQEKNQLRFGFPLFLRIGIIKKCSG